MSSDFYWESDAEHRITRRGLEGGHNRVPVFRSSEQIGERGWEVPYLSPETAAWEAHRAVLDAHQPFRDFEFSRPGDDGIEHHVTISGEPLFDASGAFTGYRGVGTDMTGRKRAEKAAVTASTGTDPVQQRAPGSMDDRSDGRSIEVNHRFCDLLGYLPEEMLERNPRNSPTRKTEGSSRQTRVLFPTGGRVLTKSRCATATGTTSRSSSTPPTCSTRTVP